MNCFKNITKGVVLLNLTEELVLGKGMKRICYFHPEDTNKVIKIPKSTSYHSDNLKEYKMFNYLKSRYDSLSSISTCYGFIDTNIGTGLLCECIRDTSGEVSKTIRSILSQNLDYSYEKVVGCVGEFSSFLIENNIQLFDLNLNNIVIKILKDDSYQAVSIDLKGRYDNNEFIPFSTYIPYFSRKKLTRRRDQLFQRMQYMHVTGKTPDF